MNSTPIFPARLRATIEALESRIAPAAVFTYTDVDGDLVTVKTSKGTNAELAGILLFDDPNPANPRQLQEIDFSSAAAVFAGTDLIVSAKRSATGGDGLVNVGDVDAANFDGGTALDLGRVTIKGDLGRIWVGDADAGTPGLRALMLQSLGESGTFTQAAGGSLTSVITGDLGSFKIAGSIVGASIGMFSDVGSITIGGSVFGSNDDGTGRISIGGAAGPVKIGGSLVGGAGAGSGQIAAVGRIASVSIGGSIIGGAGDQAGHVLSNTALGPVKIGGSIAGGDGPSSGSVRAMGGITSVKLGGSLAGGGGDSSGSVTANDIGAVKIGGDVRGDAANSGRVFALTIASVNVGGSIVSSSADFSGEIHVVGTGIGPVTIGGDVRKDGGTIGGGVLADVGSLGKVTIRGGIFGRIGVVGGFGGTVGPVLVAGSVEGGLIGGGRVLGVTVGGSLIGGTTSNSGAIFGTASLGPVKVGGDVVGGTMDYAGSIGSAGSLASVFVGGSVIGGTALRTGAIHATADSGPVVVRGDLLGGSGMESGRIDMVNAPSILIGGSLLGGTADDSGQVEASGTIRLLKIGGDLRSGPRPLAGTLERTGTIVADNLPSLTIGGSILADTATGGGTVADSASIRAAHSIGTFTVLGSIVGTSAQTVVISASGSAAPGGGRDVAIASITVKGRVERANILAGYGIDGIGNNADAQIGKITVGDWIASNLVAGVSTGSDSFFGDTNDALIAASDDAAITSRIGSVVVRGQLLGTESPLDLATFGFAAQHIVSLKIGATAIPLTAGAGSDTFATAAAVSVSATKGSFLADGFDVHVYEV